MTIKNRLNYSQTSTEKALERIYVLGVGVNVTNMAEALSTITGWIEQGLRKYVCVRDVHGVMACQKDERLKRIHNASGLTVPDGMPLVWIGQLHGFKSMGRVYGPELMQEICRISLSKGYTHFLYGGNIGVVELLKKKLEERFPGIRIVGTFTPPFRLLNENEEAALKEKVDRLKPDLFWVGLSTPKQEHFMAEHINNLDTKVMIGVGAAFDIHAGLIKDAPIFFKKTGMQWLYRLYQEPTRLWRRYFYNNPVFLYRIIKQFLIKE